MPETCSVAPPPGLCSFASTHETTVHDGTRASALLAPARVSSFSTVGTSSNSTGGQGSKETSLGACQVGSVKRGVRRREVRLLFAHLFLDGARCLNNVRACRSTRFYLTGRTQHMLLCCLFQLDMVRCLGSPVYSVHVPSLLRWTLE